MHIMTVKVNPNTDMFTVETDFTVFKYLLLIKNVNKYIENL